MKSETARIRNLVCFLCATIIFFASGCENRSHQYDSDSQTSGITPHHIIIGSSLALTGHAKYLGIQTLRGAQSYINHVNDNGGVHGRKIIIKALDDSYDPPQCLANTQRLLISDNVFALFCYVGTPTTVKILPLVEKAGIPLLGMFTGANDLRMPFNPFLINVRASYYQETAAAVRHMVEDLGIRRIAVFYQYDAYGFDGLTGSELALKKYGLTPVARGTYIRGTTDIEDGLEKIVQSNPQAVILIGTYEPCAKFISHARQYAFDPIYYTVSFSGAEELARRVSDPDNTILYMSQVVPPPDSEAAKQYRSLLQASFPEETPSYIGLEGFLNAKVLVEGLRRAGSHPTRQSFLEAVETIDNMLVSEDASIRFGPKDHQGMDQVYFTRLTGKGFRLVKDWAKQRTELLQRKGLVREEQ